MHTATIHYKLIKKIKDDRFDEDQIQQYDLLISVGTKDMQVGVIHAAESRMLLLEDYVFPSLGSATELESVLHELFDSHPILKAAFWHRIKISVKNNKFVQVPAALFAAESARDYLRFNAHLSDNEAVLDVQNPQTASITVFAMPDSLKAWFEQLYPSNAPRFFHQSSPLIEGIITEVGRDQKSPLYVYVDRFKLHILAVRNGKLLYYNHFVIKQFSDYVRYIMLVMKSLHYDQRTSQVLLWGYVGKNSPHYNEFYKYINNVAFGHRPSFVKFGYMFDEIQDHHFFDLYSMHLLGNEPNR